MEAGLQTEITQVALGYGLEYKISNYRVQSYLAPAYVVLQRRHPDLSFPAFISEVLRIRAEERQKRDPSDRDYKWHGVKAYLDEVSGASSRGESIPEQHYRADQEFLPLCAWCKKIRDEDDRWMTLDSYVSEITGKRFSHGMCPSCAAEFVPTHSGH
jgi:hypothetical protein